MDLTFKLDEINNVAGIVLAATRNFKVYALHGEMGAGKTTFIHALCEAMKVEDTVTSPTFSIINEYNVAGGGIVYHMDLYRLKSNEEAVNAGVEDCLFSGNICLVEWPDNAAKIFPENTLHIRITVVDTNTRKLQINL